jgi:hypothetical protein
MPWNSHRRIILSVPHPPLLSSHNDYLVFHSKLKRGVTEVAIILFSDTVSCLDYIPSVTKE